MPIVRTTLQQAKRELERFDWSRIDAFTDKDIAHQIVSNPDAASDMTAVLKRGKMKAP
jgi:hypothetical protein